MDNASRQQILDDYICTKGVEAKAEEQWINGNIALAARTDDWRSARVREANAISDDAKFKSFWEVRNDRGASWSWLFGRGHLHI
jgi:hypothetical protein